MIVLPIPVVTPSPGISRPADPAVIADFAGARLGVRNAPERRLKRPSGSLQTYVKYTGELLKLHALAGGRARSPVPVGGGPSGIQGPVQKRQTGVHAVVDSGMGVVELLVNMRNAGCLQPLR